MAAKQKPCLQGVLFEWDGTLIDSYDADSSAYLAMFKEMGIAWGIEELEKHYSPDWYQVYRAAKLPRRLWKEADRAWRAHYAKHQPKLISGARRVLEAIRTKQDRKSTRLNSSHTVISYAVFCLKKKKKILISFLICY